MASYDCLYIVPADVYKSMEEKAKNVEVTNIITNTQPSHSFPSHFSRDINHSLDNGPPSSFSPGIKHKQRKEKSSSVVGTDGRRRRGPIMTSYSSPQARVESRQREVMSELPKSTPFSQPDFVEDMDVDEEVKSLPDVEMQSVLGEEGEEGEKKHETKTSHKSLTLKKKDRKRKREEGEDEEEREYREEKKANLKKAMRKEEDDEMKEVINNRLDTLLGKKKEKGKEKPSQQSISRRERYKMYHNKLLHEVRQTSPYYRGTKRKTTSSPTIEPDFKRRQLVSVSPSLPQSKAVKRKRSDKEEEEEEEEERLGRRTKRVQKTHPFFIRSRVSEKRKRGDRGDENMEVDPWRDAFLSDQNYVSQAKIGNMRYAPTARPFPGVKRKSTYSNYEEEERETGIPFKSRGLRLPQSQASNVRPENQPLPLDYYEDDVIVPPNNNNE